MSSSGGPSRLRTLGKRLFRKKSPQAQEPIIEAPPSLVGHQFENMLYRTVPREVTSTNACRDLENYKYDPLPTATPHIRLLRILESWPAVVNCSLEIHPLSDVVGKFEALSYTWGTESFTTEISVNEKKLCITPSLEETLRQLYTYQHRSHILARGAIMEESLLVWIDAICLNQSDSAEIMYYIPLMGKIYSEARSTFVYLGKGNDESDVVMDTMANMNATLGRLKKKNKKGAVMLEETNYSIEHPIWNWYGCVYYRPWCKRLWILQEVILARNVLFGCGDRWVSGNDFFGVPRNLEELGLADAIAIPSSIRGANTDVGPPPFSEVVLLNDASIKYGRTEGMMEFLNFMYVTMGRLSTEPTDRLWGILGLLGDELRDELRSEMLTENTPVGRKEYWNTYIKLAKFCVLRDNIVLGKLLQSAVAVWRPPQLPFCKSLVLSKVWIPLTFSH